MSLEVNSPPVISGPLDWFHYEVILASRYRYPITLMLGFSLYGNIIMRQQSGGKSYPSWLFGWFVGIFVYGYPGAMFSDIIFANVSPRPFASNELLVIHTVWYCLVQFCEPFYKFCLRPHVFIFITIWWLADATRAGMTFGERAVDVQPTFSRGVWHCFLWCTAGPLARTIELRMRGLEAPALSAMVPNSVNILQNPALCMFFLLLSWHVFLSFFTDCKIYSGGLSEVQCGNKYQDGYAAITYISCLMHLGRSLYALHVQGKAVLGDMCCMPHIPAAAPPLRDLEAPLLQKSK